MRDHIRIVNPRAYHDAPDYSPLDANRPCARCGSRTNWRRSLAAGGGWYCCWAGDPAIIAAELRHVCTWRCAGRAS